MKHIIFCSFFMLLLFSGCMKSVDVAVDIVPDQPAIKEITVGVMNADGLLNAFPTSLNEIDVAKHTAKIYVQTFMSMTNIWVSAKLEAGCQVIPMEGAPIFGSYGDFSKPGKYEVRASSGASAVWTVAIAQDPGMPDISCLANFWTGTGVSCLDVPYPSQIVSSGGAFAVPFLSVYYPALEGKYTSADTFSNFKEIWDLFEDKNLKLVLQGHQHLYEEIRVRGVQFITAGAVCAGWWGGPFHGTQEGFLSLKVGGNGQFSWEYIDFGWETK